MEYLIVKKKASIKNACIKNIAISGQCNIKNITCKNLSVIDKIAANNIQIISLTPAGIVHNTLSGLFFSSLITNTDISNVTIGNEKLATISSANIPNTIIVRNNFGNFETSMITLSTIPTYPTDVATKAYVDSAIIPATGTSLNIPNSIVQRDSTGSFSAQTISVTDIIVTGIYNNGVSGDAVVVDANGKLGITLSSCRFKHSINDITIPSNTILNLKPVTFIYNNDPTDELQFGLIAEQAQEVLPEIVIKDDTHQPYTIRYRFLPILLLHVIKEQQTALSDMYATIHEMQQEIAMLKKCHSVN